MSHLIAFSSLRRAFLRRRIDSTTAKRSKVDEDRSSSSSVIFFRRSNSWSVAPRRSMLPRSRVFSSFNSGTARSLDSLRRSTEQLAECGRDAPLQDDHRLAAAAAHQPGALRRLRGRRRLPEHEQPQQRNEALAVGVKEAMVARSPKALGQHMLQHQPQEGGAAGVGWLAFEIERNAKGERELHQKMRRLIYLMARQRRCDKLHICWHIAGGEQVRERYAKTWDQTANKVRAEMFNEAKPDEKRMMEVAQMRFPSSSFAGLPE